MKTKNANFGRQHDNAIFDADFKVIILIYIIPTAFNKLLLLLFFRIWPQYDRKLLLIGKTTQTIFVLYFVQFF